MSRRPRRCALPVVALVVLAAGCGDGTLIFGGDFNDKPASLRLTGDIKNETPSNDVVDRVVFVFTDLTDAALAAGPPFEKYPRNDDGSLDTTAPPNFIDQESRLVDGRAFSITDIENGDLTVMFLLDNPQPDGQIDAGDNYAVFQEDDGKLNDVKGGRTVNIPEIEIIYDDTDAGGVAFTDKDITTTITRNEDSSN
jgi:hypothetical protein